MAQMNYLTFIKVKVWNINKVRWMIVNMTKNVSLFFFKFCNSFKKRFGFQAFPAVGLAIGVFRSHCWQGGHVGISLNVCGLCQRRFQPPVGHPKKMVGLNNKGSVPQNPRKHSGLGITLICTDYCCCCCGYFFLVARNCMVDSWHFVYSHYYY